MAVKVIGGMVVGMDVRVVMIVVVVG